MEFRPALVLAAGFAFAPIAWGAPQERSRDRTEAAAKLYEDGVARYAAGRSGEALAAFKEALRLQPGNASARAAVRRIEAELAARPRAERPPAPEAARPPSSARLGAAVDRLVLVRIPRWFHFNRTVGDALSRAGTVDALNGRVAQLLAERRLSLARQRPFGKEKQLRALLRRVPSLGEGESAAA